MKHFLMVGLILLCFYGTVKSENSKTIFVQNEFLKIIVNKGPIDQGRFAIETTGGDPQNQQDDNQSLIYGRPLPWTSYSSLKIDDQVFVFGGINKKSLKRTENKLNFGEVISQMSQDEMISTTTKFDSILVTQQLELFRNPISRVKDTVLIKYIIHNTDSKPHKVGLRVMLDTKLGSNDGAPFRIGDQVIDAEQKVTKNKMFDFWQAFDSLSSPNIIAQGVLNIPGKDIIPPDELYLVNWGTLSDYPWKFDFQPGNSFIRAGELEKDTSLAMYWKPVTINVGSQIIHQTLYGLGQVSLSPGELSIGMTSPSEIVAGRNSELLVVVYVLNKGGYDSKQTRLIFDFPKGIKEISNKRKYDLGKIKSGELMQLPIRLKIDSKLVKKGLNKIIAKVESSSLENNETFREISVFSPPELDVKIDAPAAKYLNKEKYLKITSKIYNPSSFELTNISTFLKVDEKLEIPIWQNKLQTIESLKPYELKKLSWYTKISEKKAEEVELNLNVSSKQTKKSISKIKVRLIKSVPDVFMEVNRKNIGKGDYFFVNLFLETKSLAKQSFSIKFDENKLSNPRVSPASWALDTMQVSKFLVEKNNIIIQNVDIVPSKSERTKIATLHFKANKKGVTELIMRQNNEIKQTMNLIVEE